jgi:hypothetical protein
MNDTIVMGSLLSLSSFVYDAATPSDPMLCQNRKSRLLQMFDI